MTLGVAEFPAAAAWPESADLPILFLLDASSGLERRMLVEWIARTAPPGAEYRIVEMPPSRRRRFGRQRVAVSVRHALDVPGDHLLTPLRVVWMADPKRRAPRLIDLLTFGDPRDPNRLLQEWIARFHPERVRVVVGDPAPGAELRRRWSEVRARGSQDPFGFAEYVVLQAGIALERAERRLRGNRYKIPRFLDAELLTRGTFRVGLISLAERTGEGLDELYRRSGRYLKEIAATHSPYVIDLIAALILVLYTQGYHRRIRYDRGQLEYLAELGQQHPVVFLPSHKSNLDHLVLMYVLYENGLPPNHTAGGDNMNFFPVGPLIRRAGVFFIRRSFKDNEPYKFVLKQYLDFLLSKRFPLEWFIEGGRSRSGKLRPPRFGMLAYVADSFRRGSCDDVVLIPTAIAYDQIQDIGAYAAEQRGGAKERETFTWMVRAIRTLRRRYGSIWLRLGEPIALSEVLTRYGEGETGDPDSDAMEIRKLAFEVANRINEATPITPISLVTLALLGARDRALTATETLKALAPYVDLVEDRGLPVTDPLTLDTPELVTAALDLLQEHGVVSRFVGGTETVYSIEPDQHLAAAYYRNTIIHFFTSGAIAELALVAASEATDDRLGVFWAEVAALRDLLKFEFFFPERDEFTAEIAAEVSRHRPDWHEAVAAGDCLDVLRSFRPFTAHWVLRPFMEAYRVVADALEARDYRKAVDEKEFAGECLALGRQYLLQRRIQSPESLSTVLFESALRLAGNYGLVEGEGPELLLRRTEFAGAITDVVRRIDVVEALVAAREAGIR
jgi:glycerol-3-phosphate O-acyltransferase